MLKILAPILLVLATTALYKLAKPRQLHPDAGLDIIQLVTKFGYSIETHEVQTEDGYFLTLHRVPGKLSNSTPILLIHGLMFGATDWISRGPGIALGLLLVDNGYDVWMGNQRGTVWSRKHKTLDADLNPEKYFDFTFHELGVYDQPAMIDYILETTKQKQLFYIGYSQGTTVLLITLSEKPEYNAKIKLMTCFSPVAYTKNLPNPYLKFAANNYEFFDDTFKKLSFNQYFPYWIFWTKLANYLCSTGSDFQWFCTWVFNQIAGVNSEIDPSFIPVIITNVPAGASIKQLLQTMQGMRSGNFSQYDHGTEENIAKYGQELPPAYDLARVTAPVSLYYADNDMLNGVEDVLRLAEELPNVINLKKVPQKNFNHLDFLFARHVVELLYNDIIQELNAFG